MRRPVYLQVPEACSESWNDMQPNGAGRYCGSCRKTVVDFSGMSDGAILAYLQQQKGAVCGRFYNDQLNRPMTLPRRPLPWLRHVLTVLLPAFLVSVKASAQTARSKAATSQAPRAAAGSTKQVTVSGTVRDPSGLPLPAATVQGAGSATATDAEGRFSISAAPGSILRISSVGFAAAVVTVTTAGAPEVVLQPAATELNEVVVQSMGDVRRVGLLAMGAVSRVHVAPLPPAAPPAEKAFTAWPNPLVSGGILHIRSERLGRGSYRAQLITMGGQPVHSARLEWGGTESAPMALPTPGVLAGTYLLRLVHERSGAAWTQQLLVVY